MAIIKKVAAALLLLGACDASSITLRGSDRGLIGAEDPHSFANDGGDGGGGNWFGQWYDMDEMGAATDISEDGKSIDMAIKPGQESAKITSKDVSAKWWLYPPPSPNSSYRAPSLSIGLVRD